MASLRLYGDPDSCSSVARLLWDHGASATRETAPSTKLLRRALHCTTLSRSVDSDVTARAGSPEELANLLAERPESMRQALVVRGNSMVLGADPDRVQSLMY